MDEQRSKTMRPAARRALVLETRRRAVETQQAAKAARNGSTGGPVPERPSAEEAKARAQIARGSRLSAFLYGPMLWWGERAGNAARRRELLAGARGSVLEIGAGTGLNLPYYPDGIERLVLAEPERNMARRLERRLAKLGTAAEVARAAAEALPFDDAEFDTVVSTLVLCTVEDPGAALAEIARVLRPGGALLFLEHVRSEEEKLARRQDRRHGPWKSFADGCNCNRRTLETMGEAGFEVASVDRAAWQRMPSIVQPLVLGSARAPRARHGQ